jgi:hypothetical protein
MHQARVGWADFKSAQPRLSKRLGSPLIAETTTTILLPALRLAITLSATASMRSTEHTYMPPNFSTNSAIKVH